MPARRPRPALTRRALPGSAMSTRPRRAPAQYWLAASNAALSIPSPDRNCAIARLACSRGNQYLILAVVRESAGRARNAQRPPRSDPGPATGSPWRHAPSSDIEPASTFRGGEAFRTGPPRLRQTCRAPHAHGRALSASAPDATAGRQLARFRVPRRNGTRPAGNRPAPYDRCRPSRSSSGFPIHSSCRRCRAPGPGSAKKTRWRPAGSAWAK